MAIQKIILDDKTEVEFGFIAPKDCDTCDDFRKRYWTIGRRVQWEQKNIFPELETDLEQYAKDEFDLINSDKQKTISNYDDDYLLEEAEKRGLHFNSASIANENIINENYLSRFAEIINRGNDIEIEGFLENLEKKYHIK